MPGAGFKRNALLVRTYVSAIMDKPYDVVKAAIVRRSYLYPARVAERRSHTDIRNRKAIIHDFVHGQTHRG